MLKYCHLVLAYFGLSILPLPHVISVEVGDPDEMTQEVNMFIRAVNSKLIISHQGREILRQIQIMMIIGHSGGNNGYPFFPGNDNNLSFSKMIDLASR
jgi:hypothetical protein